MAIRLMVDAISARLAGRCSQINEPDDAERHGEQDATRELVRHTTTISLVADAEA